LKIETKVIASQHSTTNTLHTWMLLAVEIDRINKLMILVDSDVDTLHDERKYSRW
jgi:hypothetical protein